MQHQLLDFHSTHMHMLNFIDKKLNMVTMYRLIMYYLMGLLIWAVCLGDWGLLPYTPLAIVFETALITLVCVGTNYVFAKVFEAPRNIESAYITALILVFLITPLKSFSDFSFYSLVVWASVFAMATKYMFAIRKKHIFNPAAIAIVITSFTLGLSGSWWVGTPWMTGPVLIGGLLMVRKLIRWDLVLSFFASATVTLVVSRILMGSFTITHLERFFLASPVFFFAFVMLTEPLTSPPTKTLRIWYGVIVGFFFAPTVHIGTFYFTPELALILGNVFAYIVSPKERLLLTLIEIKKVAKDTYDFIFTPDRAFTFIPGQYLEWTFEHADPDNRGNRRYFTLASSPTEATVRMGLKYYPEMSSYKKHLLELKPGGVVAASQRAGDFTLPRDKKQKLVFIAGGIGVTPFRSMLKYLVDTHEMRDIVTFYANKTLDDIAYTDVFDEAFEELAIPTVYTLTDTTSIPDTWKGERGAIDGAMIQRHVPDYTHRIFYISGPHGMVTAFEAMLSGMGVPRSNIKTDFFPGFA